MAACLSVIMDIEEEEEEESHLDLSTSTSRKVRMSYFLISSEKTGVMSRHGPHQVAVKSTTICGQKFVIFLCLRTRCRNKMRRRQWLLLLLLHLLFFFFFFFSPQVCFLARRHTQKQGVVNWIHRERDGERHRERLTILPRLLASSIFVSRSCLLFTICTLP
jgi:hypothetical protein